jgi:hypothetical protein
MMSAGSLQEHRRTPGPPVAQRHLQSLGCPGTATVAARFGPEPPTEKAPGDVPQAPARRFVMWIAGQRRRRKVAADGPRVGWSAREDA